MGEKPGGWKEGRKIIFIHYSAASFTKTTTICQDVGAFGANTNFSPPPPRVSEGQKPEIFHSISYSTLTTLLKRAGRGPCRRIRKEGPRRVGQPLEDSRRDKDAASTRRAVREGGAGLLCTGRQCWSGRYTPSRVSATIMPARYQTTL